MWYKWPWIIRGPLYLIRFLCRLVRDLDGLCTTLSSKLFKRNYTLSGQCKKRGVCCKNIAIHLSQGFWDYPLLKSFAKYWYEFVYNFTFKGQEIDLKVLVFKCKYLKSDGGCGIYKRRPFICRNYPEVRYFDRPTLLPGCGYKIQK